MLAEILAYPGHGARKYMAETGRLPHRYCYGTASASRQMMHDRAWTSMIELPTTTPLLREIFGTDDYLVWGGGGDLSLPGAIEYQHLHTDGVWPYGAGIMHPLTSGRRVAYERDAGDKGEVTSVRTDPRSAGTAVRLFNRDHDGGY